MDDRTRLTTTDVVRREGSWLCTIRDRYGEPEEVLLVPCEDDATEEDGPGVEAWINRCMHQPQRLDTGFGATIRDGEIVCPRHGSTFDACTGDCDNGEAAGTRLLSVDLDVEDGVVYLADDGYRFAHEGGIEAGESGDEREGTEGEGGDGNGNDDGGGPSSTSHISF